MLFNEKEIAMDVIVKEDMPLGRFIAILDKLPKCGYTYANTPNKDTTVVLITIAIGQMEPFYMELSNNDLYLKGLYNKDRRMVMKLQSFLQN